MKKRGANGSSVMAEIAPNQDSNTRLHGRALVIARIAFVVLVTLMLVVGAASFFLYFTRDGWQICNGGTVECQVKLQYSVEQAADFARRGIPFENVLAFRYAALLLTSFVSLLIGLFIAARRSDDWMALLIALLLIQFGTVTNAGITSSLTRAVPQLMVIVQVLNQSGIPLLILVMALFPNGRPVPAWMRIGIPLAIVLVLLVTTLPPDRAQWSPLLGAFVIIAVFGLLLYSQVLRYRRYSTFAERKQTKWVVMGFILTLVTYSIGIMLFSLDPFGDNQLLKAIVGTLCFTLLPGVFLSVCIGIAILRSRLWDIDVIVRRTATYALVTALLALIYFGSVILLQRTFAGVIGGNFEIVTVLSTLAIAALFVPLRNRIQDAIDKRFNRKKYDAQKVMEKFSQTVRDETDIDKLTAELVNVVQETMRPKSVSVWLRKDERGK